jgi:hypothetical protein
MATKDKRFEAFSLTCGGNHMPHIYHISEIGPGQVWIDRQTGDSFSPKDFRYCHKTMKEAEDHLLSLYPKADWRVFVADLSLSPDGLSERRS